ncbi:MULTISPECIES: LLM class flavin-dependent oxidoreductase [unclassified Peribacillus]|uniref:LLM class flavin-dependent oxidoreductase n=1 Tax=unclassified Peribacillus TaxID=2675266 RepID=UPI0019146261|nr:MULTISPECIES: LLM class flavin-dependent oxidoreductase [unclassified Peribacillus]MBK5443599.1 LLM class flavin-dependent oxidoreductase [Peribacillus sp. TH24]MBK5461675.1 LLM class flavin-dependent oxidoreductase [Peribacillus sp. TH27]MBK5499818.1 LLM class flavin-dependent oxidoreductase [Peribacillus sp. TH14]
MKKKKVKLGVFLAGTGHHVASWRHPNANPKANMNIDYFKGLAQTAEKGLFDLLFLADSLSVAKDSHPNILTRFEPLTLLSYLASATSNIGLVSTASTTYEEPFNVARRFASLDHITSGRAGWNVVTTSLASTAANFNKSEHLEHSLRYKRATEFVEVTKKLWDSWEDDTLIIDKETGQFIDESKFHEINHQGEFFTVKGPLNVSRSPQGHPVIVQAGSSGDGQLLAAKHAEIVFTAQENKEDAISFYNELKSHLAAFNREKSSLSIMPGLFPIVGQTEKEAKEKYEALQELIIPEIGLAIMGRYFGNVDFSSIPLDTPFADISLPDNVDSIQSKYDLIVKRATNENLTLRQTYQWVAGSRGHHIAIGTPTQIADKIEDWVNENAADGFNIMPALLPDSLTDFVELVVPELQSKGIFRTKYESNTLRGNLGLDKPVNQYSHNF